MAKGRKTRSSRTRSISPPASTPGTTTVPASAIPTVSPPSPTQSVSAGAAISASSSTSAMSSRMYAMQTPVELKAPRLEHATAEQYKAFLYKFRSYKEEDNRIQNMVNLISIIARKAISI